MIDYSPKITCSECGNSKMATNHWFRAWPVDIDVSVARTGFIVTSLDVDMVSVRDNLCKGEVHWCGEACASKGMSKMLSMVQSETAEKQQCAK